jgi:hypothetical protein
MKIRIVRARQPGLYIRGRILYKGRWVNWKGIALIPFGPPGRRWVGLAVETPTSAPAKRSGRYKRHDLQTGGIATVQYNPPVKDKINKEGG